MKNRVGTHHSYSLLACAAWVSAAAITLGLAAPGASAATVLLLTDGDGVLTAEETARRTLLQSWGHTVPTLWDASSQAAYDAAMATADAVYVSEEVNPSDVGYKLRFATIGVVSEEALLDDELGFASSDGGIESTTSVIVVDPAFGAGTVALFTSAQPAIYLQGTVATGFRAAAITPGGGKAVGSIEAGSILANTYSGNSVAAGRRVRLPWGGDAFTIASLNAYGQLVMQIGVTAAVEKPLLLHLKLDESAGTTAVDSSTYGRNGTVVGAATWVSSVRHRGSSMAGAGQVQVNTLLNNQVNFSLAAWVKINALDSSGTDIVSIGDRVVLRVTASGFSCLYYNGAGYTTLNYNADLVDTGWHHLAATFDDVANTLTLYLDGAQVASSAPTTSVSYGGGGANTIVGGHGNASTSYDLNGVVDDVRVYNKILTAQEVRQLHGFLLHYRFDEVAGPTVADSSGNGAHGVGSGALSYNHTGAYQRALRFSDTGTSDKVVAPSSILQAPTSISVSFWIKTTSASDQAVLSGANASMDNELLVFPGATTFRLYLHGANASWTIPALANGRWRHFAIVSEGATNTSTLYVDGESMGSRAFGTNGVAINIDPGGLIVGQEQDSVGGSFVNDQRVIGDLDDLRIYNRALLPEEVAELWGLMGHWKLDEGAGTTYADASLYGRHAAAASGAPTWTKGVRGSALLFDGVADQGATANKLKPPSTGALAFWFRPEATPISRERPLGIGPDWECWIDPDGILRFDLCGDGEQGGFKTLSSVCEPGKWRHVVAVFDSANDSYEIYLDGQLHKAGVSSWPLLPRPSGRLSFATRTGSTERFNGSLDDIRIYNRKLSQADVIQLYGLVGWYKLDEVSGSIAEDSSGAANTGTYFGAPLLGVAGNGNAALGSAVEFGGANHVLVSGMYKQPSSVTLSAWAKVDALDALGSDVISLGDHFMLRFDGATGGVRATYYNGASWTSLTSSPLSTGKWRHYAAVFDANDSIKLYVDGQEVATASAATISYAGLGANTRIATHGNGSGQYDFMGRLDEIRVYDRAISPEEAYQLYRGTRINGVKIVSWTETR